MFKKHTLIIHFSLKAFLIYLGHHESGRESNQGVLDCNINFSFIQYSKLLFKFLSVVLGYQNIKMLYSLMPMFLNETNMSIYDVNDSENSAGECWRLLLHRLQHHWLKPELKLASGCKMWVTEFIFENCFHFAIH